MKKYVICAIGLLQSFLVAAQNVGINTTGAAPDASAMLDVSGIDKGVLVPRVALTITTLAVPVTAPTVSLLVYNTATVADVTPGYYYWNGTVWVRLGTGNAGWNIIGNSGTIDGTNFLGTTDNVPMNIRVNNIRAGRIESAATGQTFYGYEAGLTLSGSTGTGTAFGYQALKMLPASINNNKSTAVGYQALTNSNNGQDNTVVGYRASAGATGFCSSNTAVGSQTLELNTGGSHNTAVGTNALRVNLGAANTAVGSLALDANTTGTNSVAVGYEALTSQTTGASSVAIGYRSLNTMTTAVGNTACGYSALQTAVSAGNTAVGNRALNSLGGTNAALEGSTAVGSDALRYATSGVQNTGIGFQALDILNTGSQCTALGHNADAGSPGLSNATVLGCGATVSSSNKVRIGNATVTVIEGQVAYSYPSDGRFKSNIKQDVPGLDFILKIKPVTYNFETLKFDQFLHQNDTSFKCNPADYEASKSVKQSGFIAQQVDSVMKEIKYDFNGVHRPDNPSDNYSMSYELIVVPLVKAMQEQQALIDEQKARIDKLEKMVLPMVAEKTGK